jgi:hypothetical protein
MPSAYQLTGSARQSLAGRKFKQGEMFYAF